MMKARWVVTGEIIPGEPVKEYTRVWIYTDEDDAKDKEMHDPDNPDTRLSIFNTYKIAAMHYAMELQNPALVNIVKSNFMWL